MGNLVEHVDVIVVGAGISGIGAGYFLQTECADRDYVILEGRADLGGTWDLFRYPGVRSDSDMYTLGYSFKPWTERESIALGDRILEYLRETASEFGIDDHIRYRHMVRAAIWDSSTATWTVTVDHDGTERQMTCSFLHVCAGYYSYEGGHTPEFAGRERFEGTIVHPQAWPDDLDYTDQRVVVIGSGATAMTLLPSMAKHAAHVTMLQRSPTYVVSRPSVDPIGRVLHKLLPDSWAFRVIRAKNSTLNSLFYRKTRSAPDKTRELLLKGVRERLGDEVTSAHFTPDYGPWDQRLCLIPDGDLYDAIEAGDASVVTDTIDRFTETGIELGSGDHLEADIIVTATGLELVTLGGIDITVDGKRIDFADTWTYKGLAYSDVPNLVSTFGFINASWTLRADMIAGYVCKLLNHLRDTGTDIAVPRLRASDATMRRRDFIDDFPAGYMQRSMHLLPKQGDREPWVNTQDVFRDRKLIARADVDDGVMTFERARSARSPATGPADVPAASPTSTT